VARGPRTAGGRAERRDGNVRIHAATLIPGRGDPIDNGVVVMADGRILYAGTAAGAPEPDGAQVVEATTVLPGLWDCHAHFIGSQSLDPLKWALEPAAAAGARAAEDARAALRAGITSVREVGGLGVHLARAVDDGTVPGPTIYGAGAMLSMTGGHGDLHELPVPVMRTLQDTTPYIRVCDGEVDCRRAVREMLREGARVIKVHASGGMLSVTDDPHHQQFTDAELAAIVDEAARAGRVVAAHCHGKAGIMAALRTGVRTIEHGTWLDEEAADAMVAADAILVPTCFVGTLLRQSGLEGGVPAYTMRKIAAAGDQHDRAVEIAHAMGVRIAAGTDIFASGVWGRNGEELGLLCGRGLSPLEAIEAATATAPATLGAQAPRSGQLAAGYDADVITVDADVLDDLDALADPARITGVWRAGIQVRFDD
jgi:imidazolonepropionase-like amidohydrolase